jgi:hypothetical protein
MESGIVTHLATVLGYGVIGLGSLWLVLVLLLLAFERITHVIDGHRGLLAYTWYRRPFLAWITSQEPEVAAIFGVSPDIEPDAHRSRIALIGGALFVLLESLASWYPWQLYVRAEGLEDAVAQCRMGLGEAVDMDDRRREVRERSRARRDGARTPRTGEVLGP